MTAPVDFLQQQEDEAREKENSYYEKLATDQTFFDTEMKDPVIEAAEKYHPHPELLKPSVAAQGWLSFKLGEDLQGPAYDAARDAYSNEHFGKAKTTDQEFWQDIGKDYKVQQERRGAEVELHNKVLKKAFENTLKGEPTNIAKIFSPWYEKNSEVLNKQNDYLSGAMEVVKRAQTDLEKFRPQAAKVWDIMQKTGGNPSDEDINQMSESLADLPYEDRQTLYRYAQTVSQMVEPDMPQNSLSVIARQNWKSLERSGTQIYGALIKPLVQGTMPLDEIERAALKIRDNLIKNGGTPEEIAVQQKRIDQVAVARELKNLAQTGIDPIKPVLPDGGWLSWGTAEKASYMLSGSAPYIASAFLGGPGLILGGAAIADYEYERIRTQNKDISPDAAHMIANVSGAAQTFLMKLRADALLARTPGVARLMAAILPKVGTHGASRFLGQTAGSFIQGIGGTEAQMAVSSFLPAVVAAFREDMPDADFGQIFGDFMDVQPEVFFMNAPLALIGGGVGSWKDFMNPQAIINPKTLEYRGFSEKQQAKILSAPEAVIDQAIREETPKRTQANIKSGIKQLEADIATAKAHNGAPETPTVEYAPRTDGTDFWHVKDPEGRLILSTENIDTAISAVTDFHQQQMVGEQNVAQRAKAEGVFRIAEEIVAPRPKEVVEGERVIKSPSEPAPELLQSFIEQQQQTGFRDLDTMLEKIERLPPEQREVAVANARDLLADIELRTNKAAQLLIAKKEADIGKLQRSLEKATLAGRPDMIASLQAKIDEAVTRQTPGEAAKAMQQEIVSNIGKLEAIIGILPREARGLIGGYETLAGMRTPKERLDFLQKRINKVGRVFEKHLRTFYGDKIGTILEQQKPTGKAPKSKIGVQAQREVDAIREASKLNADQTAKAMRALEAELQLTGKEALDTDATVDAMMKWDQLNRWGDLANRSAAELSQNWNDLKTLTTAGREQVKILEEKRRAEVKAKVEETRSRMEEPSPEAIFAWSQMSDTEQFVDLVKNIQISHKSFLQLLESVFPDVSWVKAMNDKIRRADNGTIDKVIEVQEQMDAALAGIFGNMTWREQYQALNNLQKKVEGIPIVAGREVTTQRIEILKARDILDGMADQGNLSAGDLERMREALAALPPDTRLEFIEFERVVKEGKKTAVSLDMDHMIQTVLSWGDTNLRAKMEASGWSQEGIDLMLEKISGDELAQELLNFGRDFYRTDYDAWNATYQKMMYMDMLKHPGYAPGRFLNAGGPDMMMGFSPFGGLVETTGFLPGPLKTRVDHGAMFKPTSFRKTFWEHAYQRAHWTSWAEVNRELNGIIGNKDIQQGLVQKIGPDGLQLINNWLRVLSNTGNQKAIEVGFMNQVLDKVISATAVRALSGSWKVILNQADSLTRFTWAMTPGEISKALADPRLGENYHTVWASPTIQRRITEGANPAVRHLFQKTRMTPSMWLDAAKKGLVPMQTFDAVMTARSANIVYTFELAKNLEAGMSQKQAHELALDRMDEAVYRYSQPMGVANKSLPEVSGNRFMKLWMLFQAEQRLTTALTTEALGKALDKRATPQERSGAYRRLAAIYGTKFLATMTIAAYRDIFTDAPSEDIWSPEAILAGALLGPLKGYFVVGTAIDLITSSISGEPLQKAENPIVQWAGHVQAATKHIDDVFAFEEDPDAFWREVNHLANSTAIWGPASGVPAMIINMIRPVIGATKEEKPPRERE